MVVILLRSYASSTTAISLHLAIIGVNELNKYILMLISDSCTVNNIKL